MLAPAPKQATRKSRWLLLAVVVAAVIVAALAAAVFLRPTPGAPLPSLRPTPPVATPSAVPAVPAGGERYVNSEEGFSILPPAGWLISTTNQEGAAVVFVETPTVAFLPTMSVFVEKAEEEVSLGTAVSQKKRELVVAHPDYTLIDDARVVTESGEPAHILGGTYTPAGSDTLRNKLLILVRGTRAYIVEGRALAIPWDTEERNALFDRVLTSLDVR